MPTKLLSMRKRGLIIAARVLILSEMDLATSYTLVGKDSP